MSKPQPIEDYLRRFDYLQKMLATTTSVVSQHWPGVLEEIETAWRLAEATLASVFGRPDRAFDENGASQKLRRLSIHAGVIQGLQPIEFALASGAYIQAACLIRQELEAVEVLRGIAQDRQLDRQAPKLRVLRHLGRAYGQITGLAHYSDHRMMLEALSGGAGDPQYHLSDDLARFLAMIHVNSVVSVAVDVADMRPYSPNDLLSPDERYYTEIALGILVDRDFLRLACERE